MFPGGSVINGRPGTQGVTMLEATQPLGQSNAQDFMKFLFFKLTCVQLHSLLMKP